MRPVTQCIVVGTWGIEVEQHRDLGLPPQGREEVKRLQLCLFPYPWTDQRAGSGCHGLASATPSTSYFAITQSAPTEKKQGK